MEEQAVRWSIKVSKDTDLNLRTFLGKHKGHLLALETHKGARIISAREFAALLVL